MKSKKRMPSPLSSNRQNAVEQGAYDGRFRNRVVPNKKRKHDRRKNKIKPSSFEQDC